MLVYIKYLPKDVLLYRLWCNARPAQYFYYCPETRHTLTLDQVRDDINNMLANGTEITLGSYQGKLLYVKISDDYLDTLQYNSHNGNGSAERIINEIKKEELNKVLLAYYKFF